MTKDLIFVVCTQSAVMWIKSGQSGWWACFSGSVTYSGIRNLAAEFMAGWYRLWEDVTHCGWQCPWPCQSATLLVTKRWMGHYHILHCCRKRSCQWINIIGIINKYVYNINIKCLDQSVSPNLSQHRICFKLLEKLKSLQAISISVFILFKPDCSPFNQALTQTYGHAPSALRFHISLAQQFLK